MSVKCLQQFHQTGKRRFSRSFGLYNMYVNGTTVTAESRDALIQNTIVQPSGVNICPLMPFKSCQRDKYDAGRESRSGTDMATSPEPSRAAFAYSTKAFFVHFVHRTKTALEDNDRVIDHHADTEDQGAHRDDV